MNKIEATNILKKFIETYIKSHGEEDVITVQLDNVDVEAFSTIVKELEKETVSRESYDHEYFLRKEHEVEIKKLRKSIRELEKDSILNILDKIRAEIEALPKTYPFINHFDMYVKEDDVKRIIDKYRAETESD